MYNIKMLLSNKEITTRVEQLAEEISIDYTEEDIVLVCVLRGAFLFCSDLVKKINLENKVEIEFIGLSSYGNFTESKGSIEVSVPLTGNIKDKHVLIVEDIVDSGRTAIFLKDFLLSHNPKSLKFASLLRKKNQLLYDIEIDYLGFDIGDYFVIGYGLDYGGRYRDLDYLGYIV